MAVTTINIQSGKTISRTAEEIASTNFIYKGVTGGAIEILNIAPNAGELNLDISDQTSRFVDVQLKVTGSTGNDVYAGSNAADNVSGLAGNDKLSGNGGADTLDGGAGNDTLDGGTGADKLSGGAGNDTYIIDSTSDSIAEAANAGIDSVQITISFTLAANLENLTLLGSENLTGTGNAAANQLIGNAGNNNLSGLAGNDLLIGNAGDDTLDGGVGKDVMYGGEGNDTYVVDNTSDKIIELSAQGTDTVKSSISFKLGANVENLLLTGTTAINGTGNSLDNSLTGNAKDNVLTAEAGNDTLDGGAGNNTLLGGLGNDTYVVRSTADKVVENANEGIDTVQSSISYALADDLENLTLTGTADIDGDGNQQDNTLVGNSGANMLDGDDGDDNISGDDGADTLLGGDGNDTLDGGEGDDLIFTGDGNNTVYIDNGDTVYGGTGIDTVHTQDSITLGELLDNVVLEGSAGISVVGNALDNVITGNVGNNTLDGGAGNDAIDGDSGDDTFLIGEDEGDDTLSGGIGSDTFVFNGTLSGDVVIDGGTEAAGTDAVVVPFYYNSAHTSISTVYSTLGTANATDKLLFTQSGDFSNVEFSHIEQIHLNDGVNITLSSEQLDAAISSIDQGSTNPGLQFYGVNGGEEETVTVVVDYSEVTFTPANTITGATATTYLMGDFQLDDASIGDLFHDVAHIDNFAINSSTDSYGRADGSNSADQGIGGAGVDNATLRLGDDTFFGNGGNDLLVGHQGNDYLDGGEGNDIFTITGFATGVIGISSKADDGSKEWNATGEQHDVIIGSEGTDTLRITSGAVDSSAGAVVLTNENFQSMERVEIGTTVSRLNVEDSALQLLHDHYYLNAGKTESTTTKAGNENGSTSVSLSFDNVSVDASGITDADENSATGGLTFVGNGNKNTFIGTQNDDIFTGNGGNDTLTGNDGDDVFVFGKVITQTVTGASNTVQTYQEVSTSLTGIDTVTDFASGQDTIQLNMDMFSAFSSKGAISADNYTEGAGVTASTADQFILFDTTTGALYYDADGSGSGLAVQFASLTGVSHLEATDFIVA